MTEPVAQTPWMSLVEFAYGNVNIETFVDFVLPFVWAEYDAHSEDVVYFIEGDMLALHLVPDGIGTFHSRLYLILDAHCVEFLANRCCEFLKEVVAFATGRLQFPND